ncbi:hypothetical protein ACQB60_33495 [Actinomycetota bacterium Odt1-20B]
MKKSTRVLAASAAAVGLAAVVGFPAHAEPDVYRGTGWKILTDQGIQSLSPDPYVIKLVKPTSSNRLTPARNKAAEAQLRRDLKRSAAQLTEITGTKFTVAKGYHRAESSCASAERHVIVVGLRWRPYPGHKRGMSRTWPCAASANHSAWGGWIWIDSEYWMPEIYKIDPWRFSNLVSHELGHAVGLDHPNVDGRDANRTADKYECATNSSKDLPVLCSPNGGYAMGKGGSVARTKAHAGEYTKWDKAGLRALKNNF